MVSPPPAMFTTSEAVTEGIRVSVQARFSPQNSNIPRRSWVFVYTITVANEGASAFQLLNRHWIITDAEGEVEEVRGPGVVGKQPFLQPGESFEYTSGCPLSTPFGSMQGSYECEDSTGKRFEVEVAGFALRQPGTMQ